MHKYVLILLSLLAPFGIWCAGCQRETGRAPMPRGPETARLARAPGTGVDESAALPPSIPALIDPEVLAVPDQPTFERIRAVMDREANLTTSMNNTGLFVLPRQDYYPEMALAPQPPAVSPEIWSRPIQPAPGTPRINLSPELSAMAPAAPSEPPIVDRLEAYPAYPMPDTPGLAPLSPMVLPSAAIIPPPPAMTLPAPAAPVSRGSEAPGDIPGLYFGLDDPLVSALSEQSPPEEKKEAVTADYFSNPNFGLFASIASLDDLASLFLGEAPKPAEAAPPNIAAAPAPPTRSVPSLPESPASSSGLLDFSVARLIDAPSAGSGRREAEPHADESGAPASPSAPPGIPFSPEPAGLESNAVPAAVPKPVAGAAALENVPPPPLPLSLDAFTPDKGVADASEPESSGSAAATWDAFTPPVKLDQQSAALDPSIDYDFSAFAKREEKQASQKVRLTPAGAEPGQKKPSSRLIEPEAPPLL